ncbi:hypothetical protein D6821_00275, partial [Candidatus Parcubacteria bacterium]
ELKVKSLVNYLTQDLNFDQLTRLEKFVQLMIERKMRGEEFKKMVARRYEDGGVGVTEALAAVMAEKITRILEHAEDVRRYRRRFENNVFFDSEEELINRLTSYVLEEYSGEMRPAQMRRLKEIVRERISGLLRKEEFLAKLDAPLEEGGAGLRRQTAQNITNYFEKIIIQGIEAHGAGH